MVEQKKEFDDFEAAKILVGALEKFNEEERSRIIKWACEKLGSKNIFKSEKNENIIGENTCNKETSEHSSVDIKTFMSHKKPANDAQFAAAVAYFYKFEVPDDLKKDFIVGSDLNDSARLVGRKRLSNPSQTLHNAYSHSGYLDQSDHGKYKLSTVGENLVAMVLSNDSDKTQPKKRKTRKNTKKTSTKKTLKKLVKKPKK